MEETLDQLLKELADKVFLDRREKTLNDLLPENLELNTQDSKKESLRKEIKSKIIEYLKL